MSGVICDLSAITEFTDEPEMGFSSYIKMKRNISKCQNLLYIFIKKFPHPGQCCVGVF